MPELPGDPLHAGGGEDAEEAQDIRGALDGALVRGGRAMLEDRGDRHDEEARGETKSGQAGDEDR